MRILPGSTGMSRCFPSRLILCFYLGALLGTGSCHGSAFLRVVTTTNARSSRHCGSTALRAYLTSALETCTPFDAASGRKLIEWLDPSKEETTTSNDTTVMMPLYPLSATYLPDRTVNCTLRNTEPRNIQMALDLEHNLHDRRFCVVLRAVDTGRIASVGTVLRVLDMDKETTSSDTAALDDQQQFKRIIVTCVPEAVVDIVSVENPHASALEYRLRHPTEYLRAAVRHRTPLPVDERSGGNDVSACYNLLCQRIQEDYNVVRTIYLDGIGTDDLPSFSVGKLADALTPMSVTNLTTEKEFWQAANVWQSLCETIREGRQLALAADRNELLVDAAIRKGGGPLKLPIHIEDLLPEDRKRVQDLELRAQQTWLHIKLDPCLDFQVLLSLSDQTDRLEYFSKMVARERQRLEELVITLKHEQQRDNESEIGPSGETSTPPRLDPPQKGAWFVDDDW
jgi:hypothetical protein